MKEVLLLYFYKNLREINRRGLRSSLGLILGVALKFYSSVAKELKLKVRKFGGLIPAFRLFFACF